MKLAYLLVSCSDTPRVTNLTQPWVFRLATHAAGYYFDMSGERELMEFRVFDWFGLPVTSQQWNDWGFDAGDHVVPMVAAGQHVDLSPYDHFVLVIDKEDAHLGATRPSDRKYTYMSARDLDAAILCHELGHQYNSNHANLETAGGVEEYGDNFCIMGAEGAKYSYKEPTLNFTNLLGQSQWRYCSQCQEMFFDGYADKGICPGAPPLGRMGGLRGHRAAGFIFTLPHDVPGPGQNTWRYCNLCHCMFFDGYPTKGVCPANPATGHMAAGYMFVLQHDVADIGQPNWRYCQACQAMFYDGYMAKGVCPARSGGHQAAGYNFSLPHDIPDHSTAGPSMVAPNLGACGWLDLGNHNVGRDVGPILRSRPSEMVIELAPLRGAPTHQYAGTPVCGWADDLLPARAGQRFMIEYRSRDVRDQGLPNIETGAPGFLAIHETTGSGRGTSSIRIGALPIEQGATTYLDSGGLDVTVAFYDKGRNTVMVRLRSEAWPPPPGQANWRYCRKCQAMFYDGYPSKGTCPKGNEHVAAGLNFVLPHDVPGPGQSDWRYCDKCQALFYDGFAGTGHCVVQGHVAAGFNFALRHDVADPGQDAWRYCSKCQMMFYDGYPSKGVCPQAQGGGHTAAGLISTCRMTLRGPDRMRGVFARSARRCFTTAILRKALARRAEDTRRSVITSVCRTMCLSGQSISAREIGVIAATARRSTLTASRRRAFVQRQAIGQRESIFDLPHDVIGPGQSDWRFCSKCHEMYYDGYPTKGACPSGGSHIAAGFNFILDHR